MGYKEGFCHITLCREASLASVWLCQRALFCGLLLALASPVFAANIKKGPYLLYSGDPTQMTVVWQADARPATSSINWGLTPACGAGSVPGQAFGSDFQFRVELKGLVPGAFYYYKVGLDGKLLTGSFRAAPPASSNHVTFYVYGDSRSDPTAQNIVTGSLMADMRADSKRRQGLIVHVGDATFDGTVEKNWTVDHFPRTEPNILDYQASMATAILRGNHDSTDDPALLRKYFPYHYVDATACYYAFDWGPVHFAVADDQITRTEGSPEYNWLSSDLSTSLKPWKIVAWHMPAYGSGAHSDNATNRLLTTSLVEPNKVAMVIAGHNHDYVRAEKNGIVHLTVGGGGAPLYSCTSPTPPYVVVCRSTYCFARVDIDGCALKLTAFDMHGAVIDSAVYSKPGCGCGLKVSVSPQGPTAVCVGSSATLSAIVTGGKEPYAYQWMEDGTDIIGATASTCVVVKGSSQDHAYNCRASDSSGSCAAVSDSASSTLSWLDPPAAPSIGSISDQDPCLQNGIGVTFTPSSSASRHDLYKDAALAVSGYASGAIYNPGDSSSHSYMIRAVKGDCFTDSPPVAGVDAICATPP